MEQIESVFYTVVEGGILVLEIIGFCILMLTAAHCVCKLFRKVKEGRIRLELAEGISMALQFKLGGEVLRTVMVREWSEMLMLGSIILVHAALTYLLHWEIKNEEARLNVHTKYVLKKKYQNAMAKALKDRENAECASCTVPPACGGESDGE